MHISLTDENTHRIERDRLFAEKPWPQESEEKDLFDEEEEEDDDDNDDLDEDEDEE